MENGCALVENRAELFALELREEKARLTELILLVAAIVAFGAAALSIFTITVILLLWEQGVLPTLAVLTTVYLAVTALAYLRLRERLAAGEAFSATREQMRKDRECLQTPN